MKNLFSRLTGFGKVLVSVFLLAVVIGGCWFAGLFNGVGSLFTKDNTPTTQVSSTNPNTQAANSNATQNPTTPAKSDVIKISLDEWIGWKPLLDANGGLTTQKDSINDKNGLKVEYVIINDADQSSTALINGNIDGAGYTVNRYAFLYDKFVKNGLNPKYVYTTNVSSGGDGIIAKSNINSIEDLYGKKVGVPKFSEAMTLMDWLIDQSSLTTEQKAEMKKNMILFDTPDDAAKAFFAGQLDAAATWQPYLSQAQEMANCKLLFSTKNATNLIVDGLIFDEKFIQNHTEDLIKLVEGAIQAHSMYTTDMKALKASMPLFSLEDDAAIVEMAADATLLGAKANKESLNGMAQALFADMSNVWKARGETADKKNAENAFSNVIVSKLNVPADIVQSEATVPVFTEQKRDEAKERVDTATKEKVDVEALITMRADIRFEPNTAVILEESYPDMDRFYDSASLLNGAIIVIEGNISDYNQTGVNTDSGIQLSYERAKAVAKYLQMKGIDPNRFVIIGNGITKQIGDNSTEEGRQMNRRTDLTFMILE